MAYDITAAALAAKQASQAASLLSTKEKNDALTAISRVLVEQADRVLEANAMDLAQAKENGMSTVMQDRLLLTKERIEGIAASVLDVVKLEDPVGQVVEGYRTVSGLNIQRIRVPMGVIGIIFESRPNVTVDAAALCLKAGSAVLLRGGKEAYRSNLAFVRLMQQALEECGLPKELIQLVEDTSRETATKMMKLNGLLDVLIPRGGAGLIRSCVENATVPVIETGTGNCHIYVDATADLEMAVNIVFNAKTSRPSVCNAAESLLVHRDVAQTFLPMCQKKLAEKNVEIRGCQETCKILGDLAVPATEEDYGKEFLDYIISCKVVGSVEEASGTSITTPPATVSASSQGFKQRRPVYGSGGFGGSVCQRFHSVYRRRRVWIGGGDRHLHPETPCQRSYGTEGAHHCKICDPWKRPGSVRKPFLRKGEGYGKARHFVQAGAGRSGAGNGSKAFLSPSCFGAGGNHPAVCFGRAGDHGGLAGGTDRQTQ